MITLVVFQRNLSHLLRYTGQASTQIHVGVWHMGSQFTLIGGKLKHYHGPSIKMGPGVMAS